MIGSKTQFPSSGGGAAPAPTAFTAGEAVVFIGETPAALAAIPVGPVVVRNTFLPSPNSITYAEGRDYRLDPATGTLRRTGDSRLPDFRTNVLFGAKHFDHSHYPGYGNHAFFAFVDYAHAPVLSWPVQPDQSAWLTRSRARLARGGPFKLVAFGDSITAGGEASASGLIFWQRWVAYLQGRYALARLTAVNGATGGDSTADGLLRLETKVLQENPDLVLIGFGMNDHNRGGVAPAQFADNLRTLIARIRARTAAEIILFSAFPPHPEWAFGSQRMEVYAAHTAAVAAETGCAYADVYHNWQARAQRKKPEDFLGNNINHPNDYGHDIYHRVFLKLGL